MAIIKWYLKNTITNELYEDVYEPSKGCRTFQIVDPTKDKWHYFDTKKAILDRIKRDGYPVDGGEFECVKFGTSKDMPLIEDVYPKDVRGVDIKEGSTVMAISEFYQTLDGRIFTIKDMSITPGKKIRFKTEEDIQIFSTQARFLVVNKTIIEELDDIK